MTAIRVLIVDDEPGIVSLCMRVLQGRGYRLQLATRGQEAIALLEAEPFDLLVVDLKMPDVDGLALIRRGRELDPHLGVVVITGFGTLDSAIQSLRSGAQGFVLKPFGPRELLEAVDQTLARRQQEQEWLALRAQLPILEIAQLLAAQGDVEEIARRLLEATLPPLGCDRGALLLLDEERGELYAAATVGGGIEPATVPRVPVGAKGIAQALAAEQPLVLGAEFECDPAIPLPLDHVVGKTAAVAALRTAQHVRGLLHLGRPSDSPPFSPSDLNLLSIIASQVASALENAHWQAEVGRQTRALTALNRAARAMVSTLELETVLEQVIAEVVRLLDVAWAAVLLHDPKADELAIAAASTPLAAALVGARLPAQAGIAGWALRERQTALVPNVQDDPRFYNQVDRLTGLTTESLLAVPLIFYDRVLGVVVAINKTSGRFTEHDVTMLESLAGIAAVAIEHARLHETIVRGKREWEDTFDAIAHGISLHDDEYRIVRANRALAGLLRTTPAALIGRRCHEVVHGLAAPPDWCPCSKAQQTGQREELEIAEPALGGVFHLSVYPQLLENGRYGCVHVLRDITARKRLEAELIRSERLAAVGQVAATIVHEVRNVLSGISGGLQYLGSTFAPGDGQQEACAVLENELERAFQILEDIRLATHPLALEPRLCSLEMIVEKVLQRMMPGITGAGLMVRRDYNDAPQLPLDGPRIEQALTNLLRNACESSPRGSEIAVAIRRGDVNSRPAGVRLTITDCGAGMTPAVLSQAGEPFFTTKRTGLGLGLAVARRLIEAHGGALELQSDPDIGTVATVILPLDLEEDFAAPGGDHA